MTAETSLARYLRDHLCLTGTKIHCAQAGCGVCVVTASFVDPSTGQTKTRSVNSCITPVLKCDGWAITTVEGLGNKADGLSVEQAALAAHDGTQCGFCSPGMVMALHSLLLNNSDPSLEEIDNVLDGNICRCTGYRPIFDAFKSFSSEAPFDLRRKLADIEDLGRSTVSYVTFTERVLTQLLTIRNLSSSRN